MPNLREEITRTFLRLSRRGTTHYSPSSKPERQTSIQPRREGREFGFYRILKRLGSGGMGEVYLAIDTRLGRQIALKFLPAHLTSEAITVRRFQQEARAASALNHPNILTIYEIGQIDGEHFIASEYIDGITLRNAMRRGPFQISTALDIAAQIASALVAAHSAGVIHRDLKPGNIMIRPDGWVKVIDFGVAKLAEPRTRNSLQEDRWTQPGTTVGTIDYMSPEQARGEETDARSDIWSLGVVLYEMLVQKRPFEGDTEYHVMVNILDRPVPPITAAESLPPGLTGIIDHTLVKDRAKRYQTARDLLSDLRQVSEALPRSHSTVRTLTVPTSSKFGKPLVLIPGIAASIMLAVAVWWWLLGGKQTVLGPDWFRIESVRQLTFNGRTKLATISPDGKYLAFVVGDKGGLETLYLKQTEQGSEEVKIPPRKIDYYGITFSPDNQTIYEVEKDETLIGKLFSLPILGDRANTPIVVDIDGPVSFSPSGNQFAFVRYVPQRGLSNLELFNGSERKTLLSIKDFTILWRTAWSPEGDRIAAFLFSNSAEGKGTGILDLVDLKGHQQRRALPAWHIIGQPCWTSGAEALIVSAAARTEDMNHAQIREVLTNSGQIHDITKDLAGYTSVSLTRDAQQLAAVKLEPKVSLWISASNDLGIGETAIAEAEDRPSLIWPDESHLVVNSRRGGYPNLWLFDLVNRHRTALTNEPYIEQDAVSVPGRDSVVFASNRSGEFHIWRFDPDSNAYTQLTFGPGYDEHPSVSPDGKWIVYTSWTGNRPGLYKIPLTGGTRSVVGSYIAANPEISPDGKSIVCQLQDPNTSRWDVAVIPFSGEGQPRLFPGFQLPVRWAPDGRALTAVLTDPANPRSIPNIWAIPLDGSARRQLTTFDDEDESIVAFAWSPRGDRLACIRAGSVGDAVLFKRQK